MNTWYRRLAAPFRGEQPVIDVTIHADNRKSRAAVEKVIEDNLEAFRALVHQNPKNTEHDEHPA